MVLQVTCHEHCPQLPHMQACQDTLGCEWHPSSETCSIHSSETFGGNGWIGVVLSMVGDIIINVGMNAMKYAHNINQDPITRQPKKHFVYVPWWWCGIVGVVGGELANLVAYGYAPASVVTPIGSIGVVTNVFITTLVLKEKFTCVNFAGVLSVIAGIVLVVYYAPRAVIEIKSDGIWEDVIYTMQGAVYFAVFVASLSVMYPLSRRYGEKYVCVYISMCAIIASLTIVCAKTFSSIFKNATDNGFDTEFLSPVPYLTLVVMVVTAVVSTGYVNKAMMTFGNAQVVPTYFALFTTCSVASVAWVYREFDCLLDTQRGALFILGILLAVGGVYLVQRSHVDPRDKDGGSFIIRPSSQASRNQIRPTGSNSGSKAGSLDGPSWSRANDLAGGEIDLERGLPPPSKEEAAGTAHIWEAPVEVQKQGGLVAVPVNGHVSGAGHGAREVPVGGSEASPVVVSGQDKGRAEGGGRGGGRDSEAAKESSLPGTVPEARVDAGARSTSSGERGGGSSGDRKRRSKGGPRRLRQLKPLPGALPNSPSKLPLLPDDDRMLPD